MYTYMKMPNMYIACFIYRDLIDICIFVCYSRRRTREKGAARGKYRHRH